MSETLPEGWAFTTLGALSTYVTSGSRDWSKYYSDHGALFVRTQDINRNRLAPANDIARVALPDQVEGKRTLIAQGDLLITITGANVGKCAYVAMPIAEAYVSQSVALVRLVECFNGHFVHRQLISPSADDARTLLQKSAYGMGRPVLNLDNVRELPVCLAPIDEQHRIVAKIEELLSHVTSARDRLSRVPAILKRFRQAVLAAACSGRLTEDWRDKQRGTEACEPLLNSLLKQRRKEWNRLQLLRLRARGKNARPETLNDKYVEPLPLLHAPDAELPEGWTWVSLEQVAFVMSGNTPKGIESRLQPSGNVPWFKVGDMNESGNERYMVKCTSFLNEEDVTGLGLGVFPKGTLIFPKRGGAIATNKKRELVRDSCVDLNTMALTPLEAIRPYVWWWFTSIDLGSLSDGSNVPQINHSDINPLAVPLPPLEEQHEIVRRLEAIFGLTRQTERQVAVAGLRANSLTQSILAKAFRGELVPTEAELARREGREYEPASVLLERIKAERESSARAKPERRRIAETKIRRRG